MRSLLLVLVFIGCSEKELDRSPLPYSREDADGTEKTAAEGKSLPLAYITDLPTGVSDSESIDVEVKGSATQYKYAFVTDASTSCADAEYGDFKDIATRLQLNLGADGDKVICLVGGDSDGNEQDPPERYQWEKFSVSREQVDVNGDGVANDTDFSFILDNLNKTITADNRAADVNEDGVIDKVDLAIVARLLKLGDEKCFEPEHIAVDRADVNGDKVVNILDLVLVAKHKGKSTLTTAEERKADVCADNQISVMDLYGVSVHFGEDVP